MFEPVTGTMVVLAATRAVGGGAGKELARRVADLVGLADAQQQLLRAIGGDVRALLEGPQKTALIHIADAKIANSTETQGELLKQARDELARAAAQETDPLRESYAWLLSAAVWTALRDREDAIVTRHLAEAHRAAVLAAQGMADPARDPPSALVKHLSGALRLLGVGAMPGEAKARLFPTVARIEAISSVGLIGLGRARVVQYIATPAALEREAAIIEVHEYATGLRELLLDRGETMGRVYAYVPQLAPGSSLSTRGATVTFWGVVYARFPLSETGGTAKTPVVLSDGRNRMELQTRGRGRQEWTSIWTSSANEA
ncbi:MAG: hypothetical protein ACHQCH_07410 [Solirubrobacterales bacterium]